MFFLVSFCLHEHLTYYPSCFYSQNHVLFLKESLSVLFLLNDCLQLSLTSCVAAACPRLAKQQCLFCLTLPCWYEDSLSQPPPAATALPLCPSRWSTPAVTFHIRPMDGNVAITCVNADMVRYG